MTTYTTAGGRGYIVCGRVAYPAAGPELFPADLWDADCAAARGELVDADIDPGDYRVLAAGADWREVYAHLRAANP